MNSPHTHKDARDAYVKGGAAALHNAPVEEWHPPADDTSPPSTTEQQNESTVMSLQEWKDGIFYDRARKEYLLLDGKTNWFSVNETMVRRQCKVRGINIKPTPGCVSSDFDVFMVHLQDHRGVAYAGPLAGHRKGLRTVNGAQILVTHEPLLIDPVAGEWRTLKALLDGMFNDGIHDQLTYLYGWLRASLECLRTRTRKPGQVLVIAGPAAFAEKLRGELPAFIHWLLYDFDIPYALRNERCGICHWHHPELLIAIRELSSHARLMSLIDRELFHAQNIRPYWEGTADELEHELTGAKSSVRTEASKLMSWNNACGTFLGRIANDMPERVEHLRTSTVRKWIIRPPDENS